MADRVSASIVLGGALSAAAYAELVTIIADEGLSVEWDGEPFDPNHRVIGHSLSLCAHEVAWGTFSALETWCAERCTPFVRWSGGYGGEWGPQRVVSRADGAPTTYGVTETDQVIITREDVEGLGSIAAILAYFDAAEFVVPPLVIEGDDLPPSPCVANPSQPEVSAYVE